MEGDNKDPKGEDSSNILTDPLNKYLGKSELLGSIIYGDISKDDLISADSYNEKLLMDKFNSLDENIRVLLLKCAVHIAVIGYGNKTYGSIRDGDNILKIEDIFNKYDICYNKNIGEKYKEDTLSARRLSRLLRFHIQKFILENNRPSYLWYKYSDKDINKIGICFPGGEHLVTDQSEADYLYSTYGNLDKLMNTKFCERLKRIYIARGIFPPEKYYNVPK